MLSSSRSFTFTADDEAPPNRGEAFAAPPARTVVEVDPDREVLTITLYVFDAALPVGSPPLNPKTVYGLLLADDASTGQLPVLPTWDNHTYALRGGETVTIGRTLRPLPQMRYALALSLAAAEDITDYRIEVLVGEHGRETCASPRHRITL